MPPFLQYERGQYATGARNSLTKVYVGESNVKRRGERQGTAAARSGHVQGGYMTTVWTASKATQTPIIDMKPTTVGMITLAISVLLSGQAHVACGAFREGCPRDDDTEVGAVF